MSTHAAAKNATDDVETAAIEASRIEASSIEARVITDLAWNGRKFSGNAQRRRRRALLFHGTFMLNFDLSLVESLLKMPEKQPDYRAARSHRDFVCNIPLARDAIKTKLQTLWNADKPLRDVPHERINALANGKYRDDAWNFKF